MPKYFLKNLNPNSNSLTELGALHIFSLVLNMHIQSEHNMNTNIYHDIIYGKTSKRRSISKKERYIVNSVIKWLGSTKGTQFILQLEKLNKKIENENKKISSCKNAHITTFLRVNK